MKQLETDKLILENVLEIEYSMTRLYELDNLINRSIVAAFEEVIKKTENQDIWEGDFRYRDGASFDPYYFSICKKGWPMYDSESYLIYFEMNYDGDVEFEYHIPYYLGFEDTIIGLQISIDARNFKNKTLREKAVEFKANLKERLEDNKSMILITENDEIIVPLKFNTEELQSILESKHRSQKLIYKIKEYFETIKLVSKEIDAVIEELGLV